MTGRLGLLCTGDSLVIFIIIIGSGETGSHHWIMSTPASHIKIDP